MKKLAKITFMLCFVALFNSCDQEALDQINSRLDALENVAIASVNQQISSINTSISSLQETDRELKGYIANLQTTSTELQKAINANNDKIDKVEAGLKNDLTLAKASLLAELQSLRAEMESHVSLINATIDSLKKEDKALEIRISDLKSYTDNEIKSTKDWATATFSTLEQYNQTVSEIAGIKQNIEAINTAIVALEERINDKIGKDIKTATEALRADIAEKATEITIAYSSAIAQAKGEIESAYTNAIQSSITSLESSMQAWVNGRLTGYYTIAETDAKITIITTEFNSRIESQKVYFEGMIGALSEEVNKKIADNKTLISNLRSDLTTLQNDVAKNTLLIAANAEAISENASSIAANAIAISNNVSSISNNADLIAANKKAITDNAKMISENTIALESLGSDVSVIAKNVADNARTIANNAALISANAVAIDNNAQAISDNAAGIANLREDLNKAKTEISSAYTQAIQSAINELNGKMDDKITAKVTAVNQEIINTINTRMDGLESRISSLESNMTSIKGQVATIINDIASIQTTITKLINRIQSVSYIPRYTDNMMRLGVYVKADQSDGKVVVGEFEIQPHSIADDLIANPSVLSMKAVRTITKSSMFIDMPIIKVTKIEDGVISIEAACDNIDLESLDFDQSFSAALSISNENANYTSTYVAVNRNPVIKFADSNVKKALLRYSIDNNSDGEISFDEVNEVIELVDLWRYYDGYYYNNTGDYCLLGGQIFSELKYFQNIICIKGFIGSANVCIPNSLLTIGDGAFNYDGSGYKYAYGSIINSVMNNTYLSLERTIKLIIPDNVETIGSRAFLSWRNLESVYFSPSSHLKTIGEFAFAQHRFKTISLPPSIKSIGSGAFYSDSDTFEELYVLSETPPDLLPGNSKVFPNSLSAIYVPQNAVEAYKEAWIIYRNLIQPIQ